MRVRGPVLLVATLALSGCATTSPVSQSPASTPSALTASATEQATPSTSAWVGSTADRTKSLSIVPPSGWKTAPSPTGASVLSISAPSATGEVYTTFNITRSAVVKQATLDSLTTDAMTQLRQTGAKVTPAADRMIGGEPAMGYLIDHTVQQKKVAQSQFFMIHGDQVYVATLTSSQQGRVAADAAQNSVFNSWSWTS